MNACTQVGLHTRSPLQNMMERQCTRWRISSDSGTSEHTGGTSVHTAEHQSEHTGGTSVHTAEHQSEHTGGTSVHKAEHQCTKWHMT